MKKEHIFPVLIIALGLVFAIIDILIFFSGGNAWLISKKLKIGAMILTLTGILACGSHPRPTCYDTAPPKEYLDSIENVRKQDSILKAEKEKFKEDSIADAEKEKQKKDSLVKVKHKKKTPVKPTCYKPVPPRLSCYDVIVDTNKFK
jgi:hypothetical protein